MNEKEMRTVVGEFIKKSLHTIIFPSAVGLGVLFASGCGNETSTFPKNIVFVDAGYAAPFPKDQKVSNDKNYVKADMMYAAPFPEVV